MSSLLFACVAVACLVSEIGAAAKNPTTPSPDFCQLPGYDVSELKSQDYWFANVTGELKACVDPTDGGSCTFYFAFCQELHLPENVSATNCSGSAVCQIGNTHSYSLGMYTDQLQFYQSEGGFSMNISDGSNTTGCTGGISTTVTLKCNKSAVWMSTNRNLTDFINIVWNSGDPSSGCPNFQISLQYSGACSNSSNHSVSPTMSSSAMPTPTTTKSHTTSMNISTKSHTTSMNVSSTQHPNSSMTTHMSMNMSTHSMHPTTSHSAGNHSATAHPGSTAMTNHASPTTASLTATIHPQSSSNPMTSSTPPPGPQPTTHPNPPSTKPATKPTENPLSHKVAGLTAGVVIFALIAFILVVALVGVAYYFYKRGANRYSTLSSNITDD